MNTAVQHFNLFYKNQASVFCSPMYLNLLTETYFVTKRNNENCGYIYQSKFNRRLKDYSELPRHLILLLLQHWSHFKLSFESFVHTSPASNTLITVVKMLLPSALFHMNHIYSIGRRPPYCKHTDGWVLNTLAHLLSDFVITASKYIFR